MNLNALEKELSTNKRFDIIKNAININDIICVAEGYGSCWLNRGIVIDKSKKNIEYVDLETKEIKKVLDCSHKVLVITKNYSSIERSSFEELAKNVIIKHEEKRKKSINYFFAFAVKNTNETIIISYKINENINKNIFTKLLNELKNKYTNNELFLLTKNNEFISINNIKYSNVRIMRSNILSWYNIYKIIIDNTKNKVIKTYDENGNEYNSRSYYFSQQIRKYFEEKEIDF